MLLFSFLRISLLRVFNLNSFKDLCYDHPTGRLPYTSSHSNNKWLSSPEIYSRAKCQKMIEGFEDYFFHKESFVGNECFVPGLIKYENYNNRYETKHSFPTVHGICMLFKDSRENAQRTSYQVQSYYHFVEDEIKLFLPGVHYQILL